MTSSTKRSAPASLLTPRACDTVLVRSHALLSRVTALVTAKFTAGAAAVFGEHPAHGSVGARIGAFIDQGAQMAAGEQSLKCSPLSNGRTTPRSSGARRVPGSGVEGGSRTPADIGKSWSARRRAHRKPARIGGGKLTETMEPGQAAKGSAPGSRDD